MPANLTPQYLKAEEEYKRAQTPDEKLAALKVMLVQIPKHKGTEKLQAELKAKIARAKDEVESEKKTPKKGVSYKIPREGAGQVVIAGPPNVGKSQILAALTSARPEVAPYPFTTHAPQPGMMPWKNVRVQLIDTPPITADYLEGYLTGMLRAADSVLLVVDLATDDGLDAADACLNRLEQSKLRLATEAPTGGDPTIEFQKTLLVANKIDESDAPERLAMLREYYANRFEIVPIAAQVGTGMEALRDRIYDFLRVIRVYCKPPGKPVDRDNPFTSPIGSNVLDIARLVHKDFAEQLKYARIWGTGVYDGQSVKRDHVLSDEDVIELHL